ncbi:hypothetical protein LIER_01322 [Lithospermum erythrorhizon]|uniref:Uncharacterized protein n=1 Tax=Lithospermum erythrorhizon TaxID=34254 RepID=A0AAV3NKJ4_LITER
MSEKPETNRLDPKGICESVFQGMPCKATQATITQEYVIHENLHHHSKGKYDLEICSLGLRVHHDLLAIIGLIHTSINKDSLERWILRSYPRKRYSSMKKTYVHINKD